jgi:phospholipid/cholesterol/gamma-HCH transport system substrate-binding protein
MRLMEEKDPRFRSLERKAGLFVLVAAACIALSVVLIGMQRDLFRTSHRVLLVADSGLNVIVGQPVKYKGFRIGKVRRVALNLEGQVVVELAIFGDYLRFVRTDSVAELTPETAIGDFVIAISAGSPTARPVADGASIGFRRALTINDVAEEVQVQIKGGMDELKKLTAGLPEASHNLAATLENTRTLTAELIGFQARLDTRLAGLDSGLQKTLATVNGELLPSLQRTANSAETVLAKGDETLASINGRLPELLAKLDRTLEHTEALTADMKRTTVALPDVVDRGDTLIRDSQILVDSAKQIWPVRNYVAPVVEKRRQVDGYE